MWGFFFSWLIFVNFSVFVLVCWYWRFSFINMLENVSVFIFKVIRLFLFKFRFLRWVRCLKLDVWILENLLEDKLRCFRFFIVMNSLWFRKVNWLNERFSFFRFFYFVLENFCKMLMVVNLFFDKFKECKCLVILEK